jgi:uncharacterized Zn-binding protein involved in type VI secretion
MSVLPAARITDPTAHSAAVVGAIGGALGGAAGGAIIGACIGGPVGALAGAVIGGIVGGVAGAIAGSSPTFIGGQIFGPCSPNVLIEGLKGARLTDLNKCNLHPQNQIISACETVRYGSLMAARQTDNSVCSGVITKGAEHTLLGGPTVQFHVHQTLWGRLTGTASGNTLVGVSESSKTMYIVSSLEYSGDGASAQYAADAKAQIEGMWGGRTANINGQPYNVDVTVNTAYRGPGDPATTGYDQVNVGAGTGRSNQSLYGDGPGQQYGTDANANSTNPPTYVAAHEYGHSLGLPDEYHDTPSGSVPNDPSKTNNLMAQTWPGADGNPPHPYDDHYQSIWNNYGLP